MEHLRAAKIASEQAQKFQDIQNGVVNIDAEAPRDEVIENTNNGAR